MEKLIVGQQLWWVPRDPRHKQKEVTVTSVGRKWATLDNNQRIDVTTLVADSGGYSPAGRCFVCREAYQARAELAAAWSSVRLEISNTYGVPDGVTLNDIESVRELLGLSPKKV